MIERYRQILDSFWCFWVALHILARCHRPGAGLWALWPFILRRFKPDLWHLSALACPHFCCCFSRIVRLEAFHSSFKLAAWVKLVLFIGFSKDPETLIRRKAEPDISQCKVANSSKCLGGPWCCTRFGRHALGVEKTQRTGNSERQRKCSRKNIQFDWSKEVWWSLEFGNQTELENKSGCLVGSKDESISYASGQAWHRPLCWRVSQIRLATSTECCFKHHCQHTWHFCTSWITRRTILHRWSSLDSLSYWHLCC